ncbi:MAG: hypothetical protein RLZZ420_622 [Bacteroidota bacterium]
MRYRNKIEFFFSFTVHTVFLLLFAKVELHAQIDRNRKEEINITSAFKPSIVRTGKLEFRADPPLKDTSAYVFKYTKSPLSFKTSVGPIEVKPIAFKSSADDENKLGETFFAKLGYGNIQNPFASLSYNSKAQDNQFSLHADHNSAKGTVADQQYSNSSLLAKFSKSINENQVADVFAGYDFNAYKLYGYDHDAITIPTDQIQQNYHHAFGGLSYQYVAGSDGQTLFTPSLRYDYIRTNRLVGENQLYIKMPVSFRIASGLHFKTAIDLQALQLSDNGKKVDAKTLLQTPLNIEYAVNQILLNGGITPVLKNDKLSILPELMASYMLPETGVRVKAGIHNELNINSMHKLLQVNPFMLPVDTLTVFHEQQYFAGFDLHSSKGLQLSFKAGYSNFKNQPLFINNGAFGNELKVLNESSLSALMLETNLTYIFSNMLKFSSGLKGYSFQKQIDYDEAYGLLPLELLFRLDWDPLKQLKTRFTTVLWSGTMSKIGSNTDVKLQDAADISMGVEYILNKKWALWIDLNNIANSRYQRWNQYPSFGFNFIGGVRYAFNKKD